LASRKSPNRWASYNKVGYDRRRWGKKLTLREYSSSIGLVVK
jgi:hypothetical protein